MDLTNYIEYDKPTPTKVILTAYFRLDKKSMLEALGVDIITINGINYKVPEEQIIKCLLFKKFGETRLELEKINY